MYTTLCINTVEISNSLKDEKITDNFPRKRTFCRNFHNLGLFCGNFLLRYSCGLLKLISTAFLKISLDNDIHNPQIILPDSLSVSFLMSAIFNENHTLKSAQYSLYFAE